MRTNRRLSAHEIHSNEYSNNEKLNIRLIEKAYTTAQKSSYAAKLT